MAQSLTSRGAIRSLYLFDCKTKRSSRFTQTDLTALGVRTSTNQLQRSSAAPSSSCHWRAPAM